MSLARYEFIKRIEQFRKTTDSEFIHSRALTEVDHNERAKMLRNGLAVIGFAILEDFIRRRTGEVFKTIGRTAVPFNKLPELVQEASTFGTLKSVEFRTKLLKDSEADWLLFLQQETEHIASTRNNPYELSEFSLGWDKSNISVGDYINNLSIFRMGEGWESIRKISVSLNSTLPSPMETFKNAAQRRHKAAHNANSDCALTDLIDFSGQARILAFAYDCMISQAVKYIIKNDKNYFKDKFRFTADELKYRFVNQNGAIWSEHALKAKKNFKNHNYAVPLPSEIKERARKRNEIIVIIDQQNYIINWEYPSLEELLLRL